MHPDACVYVPIPKGSIFKTMGQADRWNRIWLLPEEALYLLERGSLDIRWPNTPADTEDSELAQESVPAIPMSLQAAYACFLGRGGLTLERYSVFTGLRRLGYALARAPGWDDTAAAHSNDDVGKGTYTQPQQRGPGLAGIFSRIFDWLYDPLCTASTAAGPAVGCGIHRSYSMSIDESVYFARLLTHLTVDIYKKLAMIPWYDPATATQRDPLDTDAPFRVVFHVYKPSTPIKKTALPTPDFRVAVINARETTSIATLAQLGALLESTPLDPPRGEKMGRLLYMRLRHGYRNVVLAVVDQGVVSYLRVADSAFGKEKLFMSKNGPSGPKTKGHFKGRKG